MKHDRSEAVVYRMYDADDRLLWVGMSTNLIQRIVSHRATQQWWPRVAKVTVDHFAGRKAAAAAERAAIAAEAPEFNKAPGTCVSFDTLAERDAARKVRADRRAKEQLERHWWKPEGTIRCGNCQRRPEWFPKGKELHEVPCQRCGCQAFERTLAVIHVEPSGAAA